MDATAAKVVAWRILKVPQKRLTRDFVNNPQVNHTHDRTVGHSLGERVGPKDIIAISDMGWMTRSQTRKIVLSSAAPCRSDIKRELYENLSGDEDYRTACS